MSFAGSGTWGFSTSVRSRAEAAEAAKPAAQTPEQIARLKNQRMWQDFEDRWKKIAEDSERERLARERAWKERDEQAAKQREEELLNRTLHATVWGPHNATTVEIERVKRMLAGSQITVELAWMTLMKLRDLLGGIDHEKTQAKDWTI